MAFRKTTARPRRTFKRRFRRSPLRTHGSRETKWNTSRFVTVRQFPFDNEQIQNVDIVVLNPRLLFELTLQPDTPAGGPVRNIAPIINTLQGMRGVKFGGMVWDSGFHISSPITPEGEEVMVNAFSRCYETLWIREIEQEDGIPDNAPDMNSTWRPLRVDDSVFDPTENAGDLVRILHTRYALLASGTNALGPLTSEDTAFPIAPHASTWTMPGWGGTRSLRARKFIADNQQLSFNLLVTNPNPSAQNQQVITWTIGATVYWAMESQR